MVNPVFIIDTMREMDYRYFVILDTQFNTVYQQFQPVSMEEAIKRFERFLKNAGSAMYRVRIYQNNERKVSGEPKGNFFQYEIMLTESVKGEEPEPTFPQRTNPTPINGSGIPDAMQSVMTQGGMMGGVGLDRYLSEKDRILELMLRIQQLELEKKYLEEKLERRESELRREMEQQNSSETRIQGIINNVLPGLMAGFQGQAPMNGIQQANPTNMENNKSQETEKNAIVNAVNKLMKIDPDFPKNISALADLAAKKPDVYKMAVNYLNSL